MPSLLKAKQVSELFLVATCPEEMSDPDKKCLLILDLDETLIHAVDGSLNRTPDFVAGPYAVYKRPGLDEFLGIVEKFFHLAVWSSATADYVSCIVDHVFSERELRFEWSRARCVRKYDPEFQTHNWLKDLRKVKRLGYDLKRVLVVDDEPVKLQRSYGNAIYVHPFEGDEQDRELGLLGNYLVSIASLENVREVEKRGWRNMASNRKDLEH